jgi:hypothetical protein
MFAVRSESDLDGRPGLQERVENAAGDTGAQILIYGDPGVGKSTLLKYAAASCKKGVVSVSCLSDRSYEDLLEMCIARLIEFSQVGFTESSSESDEVGGTFNAKLMSVTGVTKEGTERSRSSRPCGKSQSTC